MNVLALSLLETLLVAACARPEDASGCSEQSGWLTLKFAVAAANPLTTNAGYQARHERLGD